MNLNLTQEIRSTFHAIPTALYFAWGDIRARYRRSVLGPFWIVLGTAFGVAGLGIIWSIVLKEDYRTLIPSLTVGLIIWQLISGSIMESPSVFFRNISIIRNIRSPFLIFPLQQLFRQLITFLHNFVIVIVVLCLFPPASGVHVFASLVGIIFVAANLLWISLFVGVLGTRFRDIEQLIGAFMPLCFFLSPVIYRPDHLAFAQWIVWLNPFTYLITIVRDPLMGHTPDLFVYGVVGTMTVIGWTMGLLLLKWRGNRIAFWM